MTLDGVEFLRRFLLHVLPAGFVRIRYYGLLANRYRAQNLARCRALLGAVAPGEVVPSAPQATESRPTDANERDRCTRCGVGRLRVVDALATDAGQDLTDKAPIRRDTS